MNPYLSLGVDCELFELGTYPDHLLLNLLFPTPSQFPTPPPKPTRKVHAQYTCCSESDSFM